MPDGWRRAREWPRPGRTCPSSPYLRCSAIAGRARDRGGRQSAPTCSTAHVVQIAPRAPIEMAMG